MKRKTFVLIHDDVLRDNVKEIIRVFPNYKYYFGVVKNNAYHHGVECVNSLIEGGINYLCVSSLEEALYVRKYNKEIPVLILEPVSLDFAQECADNNFTLTVESLVYVKSLIDKGIPNLKVHISLDTGMHRLGFYDKTELEEAIRLLNNSIVELEGIYTHFATAGVSDPYYNKQLEEFKRLTSGIDLTKIKIVHMDRSLTMVRHEKIPFVNGVRLGIIMYGFSQNMSKDSSLRGRIRHLRNERLRFQYGIGNIVENNDLNLHVAFSLYTEVMSVRHVMEGDVVGYSTTMVHEGYILTLPVGYADGVDKGFKQVFINGKRCNIVSDCMDMIMVYSETPIEIGTSVEIIGDNITFDNIKEYTGKNAYQLFNMITRRIVRVHIKGDKKVEIYY
ncbi:MAG TPA: alanine racemase [Bacilli bacterium]|jgi:alanine racemase|nr:alanine racemase [Bacilli bacterium]HPZ23350.1 alanine racemase [Bacilli bacterium]HQC83551.1 alanine racemase [Bacilli bacterium]